MSRQQQANDDAARSEAEYLPTMSVPPTPSKPQIIHITNATPHKTPRKAAAGTATPRKGAALTARTPSKSVLRTPGKSAARNATAGQSGSTVKKRVDTGKRIVVPLGGSEAEDGTTTDDSDENIEFDEDDEDDEDGEEGSGIEKEILHRASKATTYDGSAFIKATSFDAYLEFANQPARTSSNVFSALLPSLTHDEYTHLLRQSPARHKHAAEIAALCAKHETYFPHYYTELTQGFNILFYGYGSKRTMLNSFATTFARKKGHVVVVNAFSPTVGIKDVLASIENIPDFTSTPLPTSSTSSTTPTLEARADRIYDFFLPPSIRPSNPTTTSPRRPLFLIIHNLDSPNLRTPRAKSILALLALHPHIHLLASVDHIRAPMMFTASEAFARKHVYTAPGQGVPSSRGFAWVWHDLTTFLPYDTELSFRDPTLVSSIGAAATAASSSRRGGGTTGSGAGAGPNGPAVMTETSAKHVLASVTHKAKRLFLLLGRKQLENGGAAAAADMQQHAMPYELLSLAAREDFIASSDTALRTLLQEFKDHGLVLSAPGAGTGEVERAGAADGDVLWIPLGKDVLLRVLDELGVE